MAYSPSTSPDKIIVDRRKPHRNSDVALAVKAMRDRLSQNGRDPAFERELVKLHARSIMNSATTIPVLITVIAVVGLAAGMGSDILAWSLITLLFYSALAIIARRYDRIDVAEIEPSSATRLFLICHFLSGVGWAYFASLGCAACQVDQFPIVKAVILLIGIASTAIITASMGRALIVTFALPVLVYAGMGIDIAEPVQAMMAGLLGASLLFFGHVGGHLNRASVMFLAFRTEKDGLIAELETAKSISDEARGRAEEANLAKSRFLASMSHELRTPLNAILGFSEVMAKEVLGPMSNSTYRDYAADIHGSGQHLLDLINEILDLSRIEAGRYQLNEEPVFIVHTVDECCHLMELRARNKDIRLVRSFEPNMPRLFADERSIRQITLNLLANAVKFAPTGSDVLVRVGWTAGGGQYISVKDYGPGIPAEEIPVVLAAFGQGSIAIKSAEQGTGLGLPIVQGLVEIHGGEFQLHSKLREGTEAIAIFPHTRVMEELPALPMVAAGGRR